MERDDLLRLNKMLLDPEGFARLRARAGVRLKRRASPPGRRGSSARARQRRKSSSFAVSAAVSASASAGPGQDTELRVPNGLARLQALEKALSGSGSGSWIDGAGGGIVAASSSSSSGSSSCSSARSPHAAVASAATVVNDGDIFDEDGGEDDDEPPLLDALERRGEDEAQRSAAALEALVATPRKRSSSLAMSWGSVSPWTYGGDLTGGSRTEQGTGWLSRLAAGRGSTASSPTNSASGANGSQWSGNGRESGGGAGASAGTVIAMVDYPPHPQSLVPVFDRELHGYDPTAPEDEKWGELPFLVIESWGGLDDEFLAGESEPSPIANVFSMTDRAWGGWVAFLFFVSKLPLLSNFLIFLAFCINNGQVP